MAIMKTIRFPGDMEAREIYDEKARNSIGDLSKLNTTNKDSIVDAVNEAMTTANIDLSEYAKTDDLPTKVSQLTNDSGYLTEHQDISGKLDKEDYIDWFATGISIPESADLNTYKTNGKFYVNSESRAKTLLNRPDGMNTNFCMFVFDRTNGVKSQLMITLAGKMYIRSTSSTTWRAWVAYTTSDEIASLTEAVKVELQAELEQYAGFYTLADGETVEDAPDWAQIVIDPDGEPVAVEAIATLDDGTTVTYKLYGEAVTV